MIAQKDHTHAGPLGVAQHLGSRSSRMRRVFGMRVEDRAKVLVAEVLRAHGRITTQCAELLDVGRCGCEPLGLEAPEGRDTFRRQPGLGGESREQ